MNLVENASLKLSFPEYIRRNRLRVANVPFTSDVDCILPHNPGPL